MDFLEKMKKKVESNSRKTPGLVLRGSKPLSLSEHIGRKNGLIGEFKRATPTRKFNPPFSPFEIARIYERNGFSAVSVVVEEEFFLTTNQDLAEVRRATCLPVLKKGFFLHPDEVVEAYNQGADSILLIAGFLGREKLVELLNKCEELSLEPIVEIHSFEEMEIIADLSIGIVGINNRDLKSLKVDLGRGEALLREAKDRNIGRWHIIESGLKTAEDLRYFRQLGADGFLIGSAFMEAPDPEAKIKEFIKGLAQ